MCEPMNRLQGALPVAVLAAITFLCGPLTAVYSQAVNGTLLGAVTDAKEAVVPGATVVITEVATNISRSAVVNEDGNYVFSNLKPGIYRVEAESTGFKKIPAPTIPAQPLVG